MNFSSAYTRKLLQREFENWLYEPVALNDCNIITRQDSIYMFVDDLMDLIKSKGYQFRASRIVLAKAWARYRFKLYFGLYDGKKVRFLGPPNSKEEDLTLFHDTFNSFLWNKYLDNMSTWPDFGYDGKENSKALFSILSFAWYYIDVRNSSTSANEDDSFDSTDSEKEDQEDPYIRDQQYHP